MRYFKPILCATVTMVASGCSSTPLMRPTVLRQPAAACLTPCDPLPPPVSGNDLDVRRWEFQAVEAFGQCRRLHADCVEGTTNNGAQD